MKIKLLFVPILISMVFVANVFAEIPLTFQVNMSVKAQEGLFDVAADSITICGDFIGETGLGGAWECGAVPALSDADGDSIYTITLQMDDAAVGESFVYKFRRNDGDPWESGNDRPFTLVSPETILPVAWFDHDSVVTVYDYVENTLTFTADLSDIIGTGDGYFDPSTDELVLYGFDENDWEGFMSENTTRYLVEVPFSAGLYTCTVTVRGLADSTTHWKLKAGPADKYQNYGGWEFSTKRGYTYGPDGTTLDMPQFKPTTYPKVGNFTQDVTVLYQVDMSNPRNKHNLESVDPAIITHVGLKGACYWLPDRWIGDWSFEDTVTVDPAATPTMLMMNDSGANGDKTAGDNIWSRNVTYLAGSEGGMRMFKFNMFYPGADTVTAVEGDVFNNEFVFKDRHHFTNVTGDEAAVEFNDVFNYDGDGLNNFPDIVSAIDADGNILPTQIALSQNYPNPFNPTTVIEYQLLSRQSVELKVFNMLGMEVAILIQQTQGAGSYHVLLDAGQLQLSSGVYFCRLNAGSSTQMIKMLLLK